MTLHGRINAREYLERLGSQAPPMIQKLFPNNDAMTQISKTTMPPNHTAATVQSWFEEHKG
jgi:hypothetical protein